MRGAKSIPSEVLEVMVLTKPVLPIPLSPLGGVLALRTGRLETSCFDCVGAGYGDIAGRERRQFSLLSWFLFLECAARI